MDIMVVVLAIFQATKPFVLGGPYSVRGYNMGELGAARNILEVKQETLDKTYV